MSITETDIIAETYADLHKDLGNEVTYAMYGAIVCGALQNILQHINNGEKVRIGPYGRLDFVPEWWRAESERGDSYGQ